MPRSSSSRSHAATREKRPSKLTSAPSRKRAGSPARAFIRSKSIRTCDALSGLTRAFQRTLGPLPSGTDPLLEVAHNLVHGTELIELLVRDGDVIVVFNSHQDICVIKRIEAAIEEGAAMIAEIGMMGPTRLEDQSNDVIANCRHATLLKFSATSSSSSRQSSSRPSTGNP